MPAGRRRSVHLTEEQQEALERKMSERPAQDSLRKSGIAGKRQIAPSISAVAMKLQRSITEDTLNQALYDRAEPHEVHPSINPAAKVSSKIAAASRALERSITKDTLGHLFAFREEEGGLKERGILLDTKAAPAIQAPQEALRKNLARSNLYHALYERPSLVEMVERGLYVPATEEEYLDILDYQDEDYMPEDSYFEGDDLEANEEYYEGDEYYAEEREQEYYEESDEYEEPRAESNRSQAFHLTRLLLKTSADMGRMGECSEEEKGLLKDMIVGQDVALMSMAEAFLYTEDYEGFKEELLVLVR